MSRCRCSSMMVLALLALGVNSYADDVARFNGKWVMVEGKTVGNVVPPGHEYKVWIDGNRFKEEIISRTTYRYTIDLTTTPMSIERVIETGYGVGSVNFGIFELSDTQLKLSFSLESKSRPSGFDLALNGGGSVQVFERTSPPPAAGLDIDRKMEGDWVMLSYKSKLGDLPDFKWDPMRISDSRMRGTHVSAVEGRYSIRDEGKEIDLTFYLDKGQSRQLSRKGIYEFIDDDTLRICYRLLGQDRPKNFEAERGSGNIYRVLKRARD